VDSFSDKSMAYDTARYRLQASQTNAWW